MVSAVLYSQVNVFICIVEEDEDMFMYYDGQTEELSDEKKNSGLLEVLLSGIVLFVFRSLV